MSISEKIKVLCTRCNVSMAELARRTNQSPQNFSAKLKRESFTITELDEIALALDTTFEKNFVLPNGEKI